MGGVGLDGNFGDEDELLEEAKEIIVLAGKASTSLLQRRLRIGYSRAASILDMLEEAGIIGPSNGSKPREILISNEQLRANSDNSISGMPLHDRSESKAPESYLYQEEESSLILDNNSDQEEKLEASSQEDDLSDEDDEISEKDENEVKNDDDDFGKYFSK